MIAKRSIGSILRVIALAGLFVVHAWPLPTYAADAAVRRVVVIYDERTDLPGLARLDHGLVRTLQGGASESLEIYREMMDLSRLNRPGYVTELRDHLANKYQGKRFDVAIGVMGPALEFLLQHGSTVFPNARIVFSGIDARELGKRALPSDVSGVLLERKFAPTLRLALSLHPDTERVVVVSGGSTFDVTLLEQARAELREFDGAKDIQYWSAFPFGDLLANLSQLPAHTLVLYTTMFRDGTGKAFVPHDALMSISKAASAPVYGFLDQYVGRGIVGGDVYSLSAHGEQVGRMVLDILDHAAQARIETGGPASRQLMFDARQLDRWHINERALPAGAVVMFKPPSFWDEHRDVAIAGAIIIGVQLALILGLAWQHVHRRRAELKLRESEIRFRSIADSAPVLIWISDASGCDEFYNQEWLRVVGVAPAATHEPGWLGKIHRDQADLVAQRFAAAFKARARFEEEFRLRCSNDRWRWVFCTGVPRYDAVDGFVGYVFSATDIEEHKQIDAIRSDLAHASRLAAIGELTATLAHQLKQPLAAILMNAEAAMQLMKNDSASSAELSDIVRDIRDDDLRAAAAIAHIGEFVQKRELSLESLDLNRNIADVLRFVASECRAQGIRVDTEFEDDLPFVSCDRIQLQQVLLNLIMNAIEAMKESDLENRRLTMRTRACDSAHAEIIVTDSGVGIDPAHLPHIFESFFTTKREGMGLGLRVVRTIVESHRGRIWAHNNSGAGATFHCILPFASAVREWTSQTVQESDIHQPTQGLPGGSLAKARDGSSSLRERSIH